MGLTDFLRWKPAVAVTVNGSSITSLVLPRLVSLTVTDAVGTKSDSVSLVLADHIGLLPLAIPPTGAEIEVALGYLFATKTVGRYVVDEVTVSGPPGQMTITGYSATHGDSDEGKKPLTEQRSRSWPAGTTIGDLVAKIAGDAGFRPAVPESVASIALPHLDQLDESDLNLLSRVARDFGLIFKPGGGSIVMARPGDSTSATGQALPTVTVTPRNVSSWSMQIARRAPAEKVVATYRDQDAADTVDVEVTAPEIGDVAGASQVRRIRRQFPDEATARAAADAEAKRGARLAKTLSVTMPGNPDLMAEGRLVLAGFRPGVSGEWLITQVVHQVDSGGYRCSVSAELPPA